MTGNLILRIVKATKTEVPIKIDVIAEQNTSTSPNQTRPNYCNIRTEKIVVARILDLQNDRRFPTTYCDFVGIDLLAEETLAKIFRLLAKYVRKQILDCIPCLSMNIYPIISQAYYAEYIL